MLAPLLSWAPVLAPVLALVLAPVLSWARVLVPVRARVPVRAPALVREPLVRGMALCQKMYWVLHYGVPVCLLIGAFDWFRLALIHSCFGRALVVFV